MKRFKVGELVNYRPLECLGCVVKKGVLEGTHYIVLDLSQPNVENIQRIRVDSPFTLVEHIQGY